MGIEGEVKSSVIGWVVAGVLTLIVGAVVYAYLPKKSDLLTEIKDRISARLSSVSARATPPIPFTIKDIETPIPNSDDVLGKLLVVTGTILSKAQPTADIPAPGDDINSFLAIFSEQKSSPFKYFLGDTKEYVLGYLGLTDFQSTLSDVRFLPLGSADTETVWAQIARAGADNSALGFFLLQGKSGTWQVQACPRMKVNWSKIISPNGGTGDGYDEDAAVYDAATANPGDIKQDLGSIPKTAPIEVVPTSTIQLKDKSTADDPHLWEITQQVTMVENTQPYDYIMALWWIREGKCTLADWNNGNAMIRNAKGFKTPQAAYTAIYKTGWIGIP